MSDILMKGTEPIGQVSDLTADNVEYSSGVSVKDKIDSIDNKKVKTTLLAEQVGQGNTDIDVSYDGYEALMVSLHYYSSPFSTQIYPVSIFGETNTPTLRIYGFVDTSTNFANGSITLNLTTHKITNKRIVNTVGASTATALRVYGVNFHN